MSASQSSVKEAMLMMPLPLAFHTVSLLSFRSSLGLEIIGKENQ